MNLPKFVILIGIPGSGKSRWAIRHPEYYRVCPDEVRRTFFNSISNQSNNIAVHQMVKGMIVSALELGHDTVLDGTNLNTPHRRNLYNELPSHERLAKIFEITPEEALKRISHDIKESVQRVNVPAYSIYRNYGDFLYTKIAIQKEDFDSIETINQLEIPIQDL